MEVLKFSLGLRFDSLSDTVTDEDKLSALYELSHALEPASVEGLRIWAGEAEGEPGVYVVVFTNGKLKPMRELYAMLESDARIHAMLESRTPYVQNNVIRNYKEFDFIGEVDENGVCRGGSHELRFVREPGRPVYGGRMNILIAPNSFKGTVPAAKAVRMLSKAIRERLPEFTAVPIPTADGGDGTLDAIELAMPVHRSSVSVTGPYSDKTESSYLIAKGDKAVIESALASGLALVKDRELDPMTATSYGTGELILRAAHEGAAEISVCLGGSATNDGGLGMARAIGVKFLKDDGAEAVSACELKDIVSIDTSALDRFVSDAKITVVCDVDNPLTGPSGATMTFGPQKGAGEEKLALLEEGMLNLEKLLNAKAGRSVCSEPGSGAAGGMGAMLMALLNAGHENGAEAILALSDIDGKLKNAAFAITGEGRIDSTSLHGKAVGAVLAHAERAKVPTAIIAGCMGEGAEEVLNKAEFAEFTGSEEDALRYFEAAACRLADKLAERLRK